MKNNNRSWLPPVSLDTISAAEKRTLDQSKKPPQNKQDQISDKKKKIQKKQFLKNLEKTRPDPGLWVQGQIFPPEKKLDFEDIENKTREYYKKESSKIPLWTDTKENLDQFFTKECKLDKNPILKEYPNFLPKILESLYENRKAFTTHDSHPKYLEEVGNCKFFRYHPQLIPGHENHIFSCPVTKMDVQSGIFEDSFL